MLLAFLNSTPGKTLLLGSDYLLCHCVQRGWCAAKTLVKDAPCTLDVAVGNTISEKTETIHEEVWQRFKNKERNGVKKQDGQKSDDVEVPVALWDSMFLLSRKEDQQINTIDLTLD